MSLLKTTALAGIGFLGATALGLELEADGVGDFFEDTGDMFAHYEEAQEVYEQLEATPNTSTIKEATKALNHAIYSGDVEGIATYQQEYELYKESMRLGEPLPDRLPVLPEALAQEIGPEHTNMYNTLSNAPRELKNTLQPYFNAGFSVNHAVEQATPYALGGTLVGGGAGLLIDHQGRVNNASLAALR